MKKLVCTVALLGACALNSAGFETEKPIMTFYNKTGFEWTANAKTKLGGYRVLSTNDKTLAIPSWAESSPGGFEATFTVKTPEKYKIKIDGNELKKVGTAFDVKLDALGKLVVLPHEGEEEIKEKRSKE